jgi:uncharacterized DUF497 family protein
LAARLDAEDRRGMLARVKRDELVARRQATMTADSVRLDSLRQAAQRELQRETPPSREP